MIQNAKIAFLKKSNQSDDLSDKIARHISYEVYSRQAPGVTKGHKDFIMSRSELMRFFSCPEKWLSSEASEGSDATDWGSLAECLEMAPETLDARFVVHPETYMGGPKKDQEKPWTRQANYCKDWEQDKTEQGLIVISSETAHEAEAAVLVAHQYKPRWDLVMCSKKQVMVVGEWNDKNTKTIIPLRCLIDLVPDASHPKFGKALADSKTARNGDPEGFAKVIDEKSYDVQAALSLDLYTAATGEDRCEWIFPLQENEPPYHITKPMPALTAEFIAYGRAKYQIALREYAACLATGHWPSYPTGNRLVFGDLQYIAPDELWKYRQKGGAVESRMDYEPQPEPKREDNFDTIP